MSEDLAIIKAVMELLEYSVSFPDRLKELLKEYDYIIAKEDTNK